MWDILKVLTEASFDNLFVLAGLAFIGVAAFGNMSGKINPGRGDESLSPTQWLNGR
jgi:hypothetical protein